MGFLVFLFAMTLCSSVTENAGTAFLFGIFSWLLYRQNKRIGLLEKQRKPASAPQSPPSVARTSADHADTAPVSVQPASPSVQATPRIEESAARIAATASVTHATEKPPAKPVKPPRPKQTSEEFLAEFLGKSVAHFLTQGNPIARTGALILFLGVGFALKLAAENGFFSPELRLIVAALLSLGLLVGGWKMRHQRGQFALILQGTGLGIFYITTFIAYRMYGFIPSSLTFIFLVLITMLSGFIAVVGNTRSIAVLAITGGFLAPILSSDGGGSHIALFSYITVLNLGIFAMCWFKSWRSLNLTGFIFTFLISAGWAARYYRPEFYGSCQFFLILFAALFTFINIIYTVKQSENSKGVVDTVMTFGTPVLYLLLQWNLVKWFDYGTAISSASFGAVHIVIAKTLFARYGNRLRMLVESYLSIGVILLTLAVPFTFDGRTSSAIWALEAAALVWNGVRQQRTLLRFFGLLLLPFSTLLFLRDVMPNSASTGFLNQYFCGIFLLTAGHLISGALLLKAPAGIASNLEKRCAILALQVAVFWWAVGGCLEIAWHVRGWRAWWFDILESTIWVSSNSFIISIYSIFVSLSILAFWGIFKRFNLPGKNQAHQFLIPVQLLLIAAFSVYHAERGPFASNSHLLAVAGIIAWPLFFAVLYFILQREERDDPKSVKAWQHRLGLWTLIYLVTWEVCWIAQRFASSGWREAAVVFVPAFCALMVATKIRKSDRWPYTTNAALYCSALFLPVYWSMLASFIFDFASPSTAPLPYIPLLNALDLAQCAALIAFLTWRMRLAKFVHYPREVKNSDYGLLGGWAFVWATSTLLRIIHHSFGIQWDVVSLFKSHLVQASVSIFWSVLALTLMLLSHKKGWRQLWKAGAFLIGMVVIKLFVVDLANNGTIGRIAAFLGVGVLMLSIGYLAPIPPENKSESGKDQEKI